MQVYAPAAGINVMKKRKKDHGRRMKIEFPDEGVSAVAEFEEEFAPKTCNAIAKFLRKKFEGHAIHAMMSGRELAISVPQKLIQDNVPRENQSIFPGPGEIYYFDFPANIARGVPEAVKEIAIVYGPGTRFLTELGWVPGSLFAKITENLEGIAAVGHRAHFEGVKKIKLGLVG